MPAHAGVSQGVGKLPGPHRSIVPPREPPTRRPRSASKTRTNATPRGCVIPRPRWMAPASSRRPPDALDRLPDDRRGIPRTPHIALRPGRSEHTTRNHDQAAAIALTGLRGSLLHHPAHRGLPNPNELGERESPRWRQRHWARRLRPSPTSPAAKEEGGVKPLWEDWFGRGAASARGRFSGGGGQRLRGPSSRRAALDRSRRMRAGRGSHHYGYKNIMHLAP